MASQALKDAIKEMGGESLLAQSMLEAMGKGDDVTPVQQEVASEDVPQTGFLALGIVRSCEDSERAGRIVVESAAFPQGPQPCDYVSPIGGAGYGLFAAPGIGATVLIGRTNFADPPNQNFWFGCLYAPGQKQQKGIKSQPYVKGDATQLVKHEISDSGKPSDDTPIVSYGVPNEDEIYADNNLPDSFVLKHPAGHSISLSDKNTSDRQVQEIKLKSAGNKRILLNDAPLVENIQLIDENQNSITITSDGSELQDSIEVEAGQNIFATAKKGDIANTIQGGQGDYSITNKGKGNITLDSSNEITIEASKGIVLKCGSSRLIIKPDGIVIKAHKVQVQGSTGDVNVQGISLTRHVHFPGRPTTTPPKP